MSTGLMTSRLYALKTVILAIIREILTPDIILSAIGEPQRETKLKSVTLKLNSHKVATYTTHKTARTARTDVISWTHPKTQQ